MKARVLRADGRRAFGWKFAAAAALFPLLVLMDSAVDLQYIFTHQDIYSVYFFHMNSIQMGGLYGRYLAVMLAAVPFAAAFTEEYENGMTALAIYRCGRRRYFASKFGITLLAGALVCGVGMSLLFAGLRMTGLPLFQEHELMDGGNFIRYITAAAQWPEGFFLWAVYYALLDGAVMAGIAMWVSGYVQNRYVVYVSPAIALFTMIQSARVLRIPDSLRLDRLLSMRGTVGHDGWTGVLTTVYAAVVLTVLWLDFYRRGRKVTGCG